jgi:hypothetical protein
MKMKIVMENIKNVVFGCDFEKILPTQIEFGLNNDLPKKEYQNLDEYLKSIIIYKELMKGEVASNKKLDVFISGEITRTEYKIEKEKQVDENPFNRPDNMFEKSLGEDSGVTFDNTFSWSDIKKRKFEPNQWVIKDLIPERGMTILAGISGEGKTWLAMNMAKHISEGTNFLDQTKFVTKKKKVLYIDFENGTREIQTRGLKLNLTENENIFFSFPEKICLRTIEEVEGLFEVINFDHYEVIFIDTFRAVSGGLKEEKAEEVRSFLNNFKPLKEKGIALIWLDHFRKPMRLEGSTPKKEFLFGSQDKVGSVEVLIMLKKDSDIISLYQTKNRLSPEIKPFNIKMVDEFDNTGNIVKLELVYEGEFDEKLSKMSEAMGHIPDLLIDGPRSTKEIQTILSETKKIGEKNTTNALKGLEKQGVIGSRANSKGRGKEYYLINSSDVVGPDNEFDLFAGN